MNGKGHQAPHKQRYGTSLFPPHSPKLFFSVDLGGGGILKRIIYTKHSLGPIDDLEDHVKSFKHSHQEWKSARISGTFCEAHVVMSLAAVWALPANANKINQRKLFCK